MNQFIALTSAMSTDQPITHSFYLSVTFLLRNKKLT